MLRALRLVNFRSLVDTGEVELRPLTVLVGANSSGKSSLLRFFPLLRQTEREESGSPLLFFGPDVDLGEFKDVVGRHGAEPVIGVELRFDASFEGVADPTRLQVEIVQDAAIGSYVRRLELAVHDDRVALTMDAAGAILGVFVNGESIDVAVAGIRMRVRALVPVVESDEGRLLQEIAERIDQHAADLGLPDGAEVLPPMESFSRTDLLDHLATRYGVHRSGHIEVVAARLSGLSLLEDFPGLLADCAQALRDVARGVAYIGPFRSTPLRFYRRADLAVDRISKEGDNLAMVLNALTPEEREGFSAWVRKLFGFGIRLETDGSQFVLTVEEVAGAHVNLADAGFGLSQVLPVVVQSWLGTQPARARRSRHPVGTSPRLFAVEQPELHLHPRHQAHLADMFVGLMRVNQELRRRMPILVETHSEALINRLGELVAAGRLDPRDVVVLVFERDEQGRTAIRRSEFDGQGALQNWPVGFFLA